MNPPEDHDRQLLDRYVARRDEAAFRTLVDRHLPIVHGVARRITASDDLAKDVAQSVFIRLAERAAVIPRKLALPAWLHRVTRDFAIDLVRAEASRKKRELRTSLHPAEAMDSPEPSWPELAPVLDELIDRLPGADREAVLMRYYYNEPHARVGARLGISEEAARQRSLRALEKLRNLLRKRGIATTTAALTAILPAHAASVPAAIPAGLSLSIAQAAQGVVPIVPHGLHAAFLTVTTTQKVAFAAAAVVFLAATVYTLRPGDTAISDPTAKTGALAMTSAGEKSPARTHPTRPIPATAEGRRERLQAILAIPSDAERTRELIAYLDRLSRDQFAETEDACQSADQGDHRWEADLVMAAWTRADLNGALDYATQHGVTSLMAVVDTWAASDPSAAVAWAREHPTDGSVNLYLNTALASIARTDPAAALRVIGETKDVADQRNSIGVLLAIMGGQPDVMDGLLAACPEGPQRGMILGRAASLMANTDPAAAYAILRDNPEAVESSYPTLLFAGWAERDLSSLTTELGQMAPGELRGQALGAAASSMAATKPREALALLQQYPEGQNDEAIGGVLTSAMSSDPAYAMDQIQLLSSQPLRDQAYESQLRVWLITHPEAAHAWIDQSTSLPQAVREKLSKL